eukprot:scaffold157037_cov37-Tisochrysis_lutea.AAC.1
MPESKRTVSWVGLSAHCQCHCPRLLPRPVEASALALLQQSSVQSEVPAYRRMQRAGCAVSTCGRRRSPALSLRLA